MKTRQMGTNGPDLSEIGLGCMSFAGFYGPCEESQARDTLSAAFDAGITFLDTANVYGMGLSEEIIGRFIKDNPGKFSIHTKGGIYRDPQTNERCFKNDEKILRGELENSLKRLGVEYVEMYYIHRRDPEMEIEEVMETLLKFKQEGKIGGIGFSEIAPSSLRRAWEIGPVMAVQSEYSLWTRYPDLGLVQTCKELGTALVAFSPMGRGIFAKKTPNPKEFRPTDFRSGSPRFSEPNFSYNVQKIKQFIRLAADMGGSPASLAMAWLLARGEHVFPIPGTRSVEHIRELAAGAELNLSAEEMLAIEKVLPVGWAHGDRYTQGQWIGPEKYC